MRPPAKIMLIRHAEKPAKNGAPYGVTPDGNHDINCLSARGWQRAGALACLFAPTRGPLQDSQIATPQFLYATDIAPGSPSNREQQTITALSSKLGLTMNTKHVKQDHKQAVNDVLARDGTVLICWDHKKIPAIANEILGNTTTAPQKWKKKRFDLMWVFDWDPSTDSYSFSQVPQRLLPGDTSKPIKPKHSP